MSNTHVAPPKPQISFGKFDNVDMRIGVIESAKVVDGTRHPCRQLLIFLGELGTRSSIGQYALVPEDELIGLPVVVCINLGSRQMGEHQSDALVLGVPHPENPEGQAQAIPLQAPATTEPGTRVY